jgi:hypothetical protein
MPVKPTFADQKLAERYDAMVASLKNSGKVDSNLKITVREALTTNDMNILMPTTIETIMLDAAEPEYLASQFLRTINLGEGRSMEFINFGAIRASEIAEGQEYPEQSLDIAKFGGKLTTFMSLSRRVAMRVDNYFGKPRPARQAVPFHVERNETSPVAPS